MALEARRTAVPFASVMLVAATWTGSASAQFEGVPEPVVPASQRLRGNPNVSNAIILAGGSVWITSEVLKSILAPAECRFCGRDAQGRNQVNGVDTGVREALVWKNRAAADTISNLTAFGLSPFAGFGLVFLASAQENRFSGYTLDALVIAETTIIAINLNQATKFLVGRERPYVAQLSADEKKRTRDPGDNNLSFYSGHSSFTFALAVSAGTVSSMRGYAMTPYVWSFGLSSAVATAYFRIAADKHYFTDVVLGAVVGSLVGVGIPYLFHRPVADAGAPGGAAAGTAPQMMTYAVQF
jgi:membrane-associated phospholipid phosphatase